MEDCLSVHLPVDRASIKYGIKMRYNQHHRSPLWLSDTVEPSQLRQLQSQLLQRNQYDDQYWRRHFPTTDLYQVVDANMPSDVKRIWNRSGYPGNTPTSREFHFTRYFPMATFYFISWILQTSPRQVVDLGCGANLFKRMVPGLIGIDPVHPAADICDYVDKDFVRGHLDHFDAVMAINSLHFVGLEQFSSVIDDVFSMLAPGGRAFVTFGLDQMVSHTSDRCWHDIFGKAATETSLSEVVTHLDAMLQLRQHQFLVVDQYFFVQDELGPIMLGNPIDGNIRLVMERPL